MARDDAEPVTALRKAVEQGRNRGILDLPAPGSWWKLELLQAVKHEQMFSFAGELREPLATILRQSFCRIGILEELQRFGHERVGVGIAAGRRALPVERPHENSS